MYGITLIDGINKYKQKSSTLYQKQNFVKILKMCVDKFKRTIEKRSNLNFLHKDTHKYMHTYEYIYRHVYINIFICMHIFINLNVCIYIQINNLHRNANDLNTVSVRSRG